MSRHECRSDDCTTCEARIEQAEDDRRGYMAPSDVDYWASAAEDREFGRRYER